MANHAILVGDPVPPPLQIQNEITLSAWIYVTGYPAGSTLGLIIRNSLVGLAPYLGKFRALNQIGEFHCHSFFSELRPLPVVVQ